MSPEGSPSVWPIDLEVAAGRACIEHVLPGQRYEKTLLEVVDAAIDATKSAKAQRGAEAAGWKPGGVA